MARISYDDRAAAAFAAARQLPLAGLTSWRDAIRRHLAPRPGMRVLDLGAGTGAWATALSGWFDVTVVAVEPAAAMRDRSSCPVMIGGDAAAIPLRPGAADGAWLSTMVLHLPDLPAAALELARVLWPGGPVLIRSAFAGRHGGIGLTRYWPETAAVLDGYPSVGAVRAAFTSAGFRFAALEPVPQVTADSLATVAATLRRDAHTPLLLISDSAYAAGLTRLRAAAVADTGPVIDVLDLLAMHAPERRQPRIAGSASPALPGPPAAGEPR